MADPFRSLRVRAAVRVFAGMLTFVVGVLLIEASPSLAVLFAAALLLPGVLLTSGGAGAFLRVGQLQESARAASRGDQRRHQTLANLEGHIFALMLTVAEADGRSSEEEKELVRRFLLERFADPHTLSALRRWNGVPLQLQQIQPTCQRLAKAIGMADREILFEWACLVALVDERFNPAESEVLSAMARGLEIHPAHARRLFHRARQQILNRRGRRETTRADVRSAALQVLGLDRNATDDDIRKRHRQLAKKFHPDAHTAKGTDAVEKATARFREVQKAYEILRTT